MALLLPNCVEYPLVFAGAAGAGVILTTINPLYTSMEIAKQIKLSRAKWIITTEQLAPKFLEAIEKLGDKDSWKDRILIAGFSSSKYLLYLSCFYSVIFYVSFLTHRYILLFHTDFAASH